MGLSGPRAVAGMMIDVTCMQDQEPQLKPRGLGGRGGSRGGGVVVNVAQRQETFVDRWGEAVPRVDDSPPTCDPPLIS